MVQAPARFGLVAHVDDLMALNADAHPGAELAAVFHQHLLAEPVAEPLLHELAAARDVRGDEVDVLEPPHSPFA